MRQRGGTAFAHLYRTARWQRLRARQLEREPLCRYCAEDGRVTEATVCDHLDGHPVGETEAKFWAGPFGSVCRMCHDSLSRRRDNGKAVVSIGPDGWPLP